MLTCLIHTMAASRFGMPCPRWRLEKPLLRLRYRLAPFARFDFMAGQFEKHPLSSHYGWEATCCACKVLVFGKFRVRTGGRFRKPRFLAAAPLLEPRVIERDRQLEAGRSMCSTVYIGKRSSCRFSSRPSLPRTV
jgi:hypothetical protein